MVLNQITMFSNSFGAVVAGALVALPFAARAANPSTLPASQFTLTTTYTQYSAINAALVSKLGVASVHTVMSHANHNRTGLPSSFKPKGLYGGFRFDSTDNNDCTNFPQGITTSRDAVGSANSGNYDGHQLVVVSWYTMNACGGDTTRSRITLVDWDATYPNAYRKVLLVEPTGSASAPNFKDVPIHAGGISWYGHYLYVAETGKGLRIFDMRKILKTNSGGAASAIGNHNGTFYAHNYAYVLPQVGRVVSHTTSGTNVVWSTVSLDRVSKSLVVSEYTCPSNCTKYPNRAPRAIRYPFGSGGTFNATTTASQALKLPFYHLNGAASHNGRWWFADSSGKKLYYWKPGTNSKSFAWVSGAESISYWEDPNNADLLWSLTESKGSRQVFAVKQATYG